MRNTIGNEMRMFDATIALCDKHSAIVATCGPAVRTLARIRLAVGEIHETAGIQAWIAKGVAADRDAREDNMIPSLLKAGGTLNLFGVETENVHLQTNTDFTSSKLKRMKAGDLLVVADNIFTETQARLTELASYDYSASDLATFRTDLEAFRASISYVRSAVSEQVSATSQLPVLSRKIKRLMRKTLDAQMAGFEKTHPAFFKAYKSVRKVIHYGERHEKPTEEIETSTSLDKLSATDVQHNQELFSIAPQEASKNDQTETPPIFFNSIEVPEIISEILVNENRSSAIAIGMGVRLSPNSCKSLKFRNHIPILSIPQSFKSCSEPHRFPKLANTHLI